MLFLTCPVSVWAAGESSGESGVPIWLCIPFAGLLLCIAVMPLVKGEWWEAHQPLVVALWIIVLVIPFAVLYGVGDTVETVLECTVNDYLTFIILLFGLFCVSGNITMEGDFAGSPRINVGLLAIGTLLSSCIGTTGASGDKNEFLEKKKKPYYDILYLYGIQYGRLSDSHRRSAPSDGLYEGSAVFLEYPSFPGAAL